MPRSLVEAAEVSFDRHRERLEELTNVRLSMARVDNSGSGEHGRYCLRDDQGKDVARFVIEQMPSCNGAVLLRGFEVARGHRRRGVGAALMTAWLDAARLASRMMCLANTLADDEGQSALMRKSGWRTAEEYVHAATGERITLWIKNLET